MVVYPVSTLPTRALFMQKTKKSIVKRYKITGRGKIMRRTPGRRHLLGSKSKKQKRQSRKDKHVTPGVARNIRMALPYSF
jgi:large subunit ribosomal protein L35